MKQLIKTLVVIFSLFITACNVEDETIPVSFTGDKFNVESGQLKSFDIKEWQHFHYPHLISVTLTNQNTNVKYTTIANNGTSFFTKGTDIVHLPVGMYSCSVNGGGYPDSDNTYSASYYFWTIKDTVINITPNTTIVKFNLDKTAALVVKDMTSDIQLIAYRNASLYWTGRGVYDFAYVTPGSYSGIYTDTLGNQTSTEWFDIKEDNYYYFVTPSSLKSIVTIPEFTKNEVNF